MNTTLGSVFASILHNGAALLGATAIPAAISFLSVGPTGGAADYAASHPYVQAAYVIGALVLRDILKNVPAFAASSGTVTPAAVVHAVTPVKTTIIS